MKKFKVIYLNVAVYLETDLTEEEIKNLVTELYYEVNDNLITETRINGYELNHN